jgi:2-polyprenyl-6-methoxyphenol hydroxylase-like FAD-dependent oxidoreductase
MARIIIVGGGIGGLAAALASAAGGHEVVVLERAAEFGEVGAGIQIAPNGLHALARLGLGEVVHTIAVQMDELRMMNGVTGRLVARVPLTAEYQRRFGAPYLVVHRAELHRLLLDACAASPAIELRGGAGVVGYQQSDGVVARLTNGSVVRGDALIGADGVHSAVRAQLVGDGEPRVAGITVYRAIVPIEQVPNDLRLLSSVTWWTGPGCHLVHYPIGGGRLLNLAPSKETGATTVIAGVPVSGEQVRAELSSLCATAQRLLNLTDDWKTWTLIDRDPVDQWADGRVVLLGDAAHPMLHYLAQGACQALEDAVVLGNLLAGQPATAFPELFMQYCAERRNHTARLQRMARESVRLWHPTGAAADARDAAMSAMSANELHDHLAWLHQSPFAAASATTLT